MSVQLILDSSADLRSSLRNRFPTVPLSLSFGDTVYKDGVDLTRQEFYERLVESDVLPTTSQPSPEAFSEAFQNAADRGDQAVVLTLSSQISGTYQSARIAAEDFAGTVRVVDSLSASIGIGILAEYAGSLLEKGAGMEELADMLEREREYICVIAMLDTLEYLKRGGRISKTAAVAGELLSIKPVITVKEGALSILGKARGSRKGNNLLVKKIESAGGVDFSRPLLLGYTGISDALLQKYIQDSSALWAGHSDSLEIAQVDSVIGTHTGPGTIAVAFFKKNEPAG